jgi:hypothetical protein
VWYGQSLVASLLPPHNPFTMPLPLCPIVPAPSQEAIHGLSAEQSKNGFVLTCQTHPTGPGLEVELGMYDTVYESQYGQYEKKVSEAK